MLPEARATSTIFIKTYQNLKFSLDSAMKFALQKKLSYKEEYKQNFTDEMFTINKTSTFKPPTYNFRDESGDKINGKFHELELMKVNGRIHFVQNFDIYLKSAGSMNTHNGNTRPVIRNLLAHPNRLDGDWRVDKATETKNPLSYAHYYAEDGIEISFTRWIRNNCHGRL